MCVSGWVGVGLGVGEQTNTHPGGGGGHGVVDLIYVCVPVVGTFLCLSLSSSDWLCHVSYSHILLSIIICHRPPCPFEISTPHPLSPWSTTPLLLFLSG
jgi:hypothetical protein